jgi:hypothetical protein
VDGFGVATDRQFFQDRIRRGRRRAWLNLPITPIFFGILIIVAAFGIRETGVASLLLDSPAPIVGSVSARSFDLCTRAPRVTCVVDGDTFWLDGTKIRIADINTPETGQPQCAAEAILGRRRTNMAASCGSSSVTGARWGRCWFRKALRMNGGAGARAGAEPQRRQSIRI